MRFVSVILIAVSLLAGCATGGEFTPQGQFVLNSAAQKVGYIAYRIVPEARGPLTAICIIADAPVLTDLEMARLKAELQKVWSEANKITTTDAQIVILLLNDIVGYVGLNKDQKVDTESVRAVVSSMCGGVRLAGGA